MQLTPRFITSLLLALGLGCTSCGNGSAETQQKKTLPAESTAGAAARIPFDKHIVVDQFGYRPSDKKIAVIRNPHTGFDANAPFVAGKNYEVRRTDNGEVVYSGHPVEWNDGKTEPSSGDSGWWFDFSTVSKPGKYFIVDVQKNHRSPTFNIVNDVYKNILKAATRMFFYQRSGMAKQQPWAEACWTDDAAYLGENQDIQARDVTDRGNADKVRDMSGGWFDAGDTNKYVTFAVPVVHQLLSAYQNNPAAFTDDFNIPESGNGIPDIIDEVKWETDWLKKMQFDDGTVALKVGAIKLVSASPPSSDKSPRYYVPGCTSSTIAEASMFAHASWVYRNFEKLSADADNLRVRAIAAWKAYQSNNDKQTHCDTQTVLAGNADLDATDQTSVATEAAIYLFALTGNTDYEEFVKAHYREMRPYRDIGWTRYNADQGEALLFYASLPNANQDVAKTILNDKRADAAARNGIYGNNDDDLYRAYLHDLQYHWGSNQPRANYGNTNMDMVTYKLDPSNAIAYEQRALDTLHYFHGVNPLGMVYLTNMYSYGATNSANEIFHTWFRARSKWSDALTSECGPAPGYVPGGPNSALKDVPKDLSPPSNQPAQKSYLDWNLDWNTKLNRQEAAWEVTEPGIYFQAAYVKLLSEFVDRRDTPIAQ